MDASGDTAITKTGVSAFTPEFASPEQVQGKTVTFASDIYSAGVLLYRLLTGRAPYRFNDYSPAAVAQTIHQTEPEASGLDAPLDAILSTALRKNPEERYSSAQELDADLARYLEGDPVHARRGRKLARMAMIAAAMVVCAAAGWAIFRGRLPQSIAGGGFPFSSGDAADRYLSNGLTDEITEALSRLKSLRVIAPASVAQFRGRNVDFREAGRALQVGNILEGSVEREGDRLKIVAKLERVADGTVLWSDTFERQPSDCEGTVRPKWARGLQKSGHCSPRKSSGTSPKAEAHDYLMKARYEPQEFTSESDQTSGDGSSARHRSGSGIRGRLCFR